MARVVALHVAAQAHGPMTAVGSVVAEAGRGLAGDRYFGTRHRHISVQSAEQLAAAADARGGPVPAADTRRNVTLDAGEVPTEPGARLVIGDVVLEVVRRAAPCRVMETAVGPGARRAMHGRGGAVFRVLTSGTIALGDAAGVGEAEGEGVPTRVNG